MKDNLRNTEDGMSDDPTGDRRARELKAAFLRKMAHEMRTPLSSMLMLAELLADNAGGRLGEKEIGYARKILRAGTEIRELLHDVLELSRIETGAFEVEPAEVPLAPLADELAAEFPGLAVEIAPTAPATLATDRRHLARILKVLLGHAERVALAGTVVLRIAAAGGAVELAVRHGGPRVAEDRRATLFEPFQPGRQGLGLAIARALAELLGGRLALRGDETVDAFVGDAFVGDAIVLELPLRA